MSSIGSNAPDPRHLLLVQASAAGKEGTVRQLLSESAWHSAMDRDALRQALQRCAARGSVSISSFLIEKGAEVDARRENEVAALFRASENGHVAVVRLLLDKGATTELGRDRYGRTGIFPAVLKGYVEVVSLLLERGANVNARDKEERTVLVHLMAEKANPNYKRGEEILKLLLEKGADVEARDSSKRTALIWASTTGKVEMVRLLLDGKRKPNIEA
jgi:ankyrin repeat protein